MNNNNTCPFSSYLPNFLPSLFFASSIIMNPPAFFPPDGDGPSPPRKELQIQGPRPAPLKVRKDSYKIKKPPAAPLPPAAHHRHAAPPPPAPDNHNREPVIIYTISPRVIHTTTNDFLSVVQRLTGNYATSPSASDLAASGAGDVSPAARLASIEKTSPPKERDRGGSGGAGVIGLMEGVEVGQIPGILSPAPSTLPPISPGFFSPAPDPQTLSVLQDLNHFLQGNSFISSPSPRNLFSAPIISPTLFPDFFNQLWDF